MAEVSLREPSAVQEKTYVSVFHELCTKFDFGVDMYNLVAEQGEPHSRTFFMNLTVDMLGISGNPLIAINYRKKSAIIEI